jgi:hypothetical protein
MVASMPGGRAMSGAHALLRLWLISGRATDRTTVEELQEAYEHCLKFGPALGTYYTDLVARQLAQDEMRLPTAVVLRVQWATEAAKAWGNS